MKRLICLVISMLLLSSISGVAYRTTTETEKATMDDDVPIWEMGNSWRYEIVGLSLELNQSGEVFKLDLSMKDLTTRVGGLTSTYYNLDVSGKISGLFDYNDGKDTKLGGILFITRISSGTINIRQNDLSCDEANIVISSIAILFEHPLFLPIPIPLPLTITLNIKQEVPRPLIDFPLYDGKEGIIPETNISTNIKVESILLSILNKINSDFPEEVIFYQNFTLPMLLYSVNEEQLSVAGKTYTVYNIEFFEGLLGSIYYAPAAGNYVKASAEIDSNGLKFSLSGELKETTYK